MHQELMQLLTGDKLTTDQINAVAKEHADKITALASQIAPEIVNIHDALTPAQRQKLADRAQQMHQKHQQGGFGGPGQ